MLRVIISVVIISIILFTIAVSVVVWFNKRAIILNLMFPGAQLNDLLALPARYVLRNNTKTETSSLRRGTLYTCYTDDMRAINCYTTVSPQEWHRAEASAAASPHHKIKTLLVMYAHGNAGNLFTGWATVLDMVVESCRTAVHAIDPSTRVVGVAFDYAGYTGENAKATPQNSIEYWQCVYSDALKRVLPTHLLCYGRSIGGAVSVHGLARELRSIPSQGSGLSSPKHRALFLETPFLGLPTTRIFGSKYVRDIFPCDDKLRYLNRQGVPISVVLADYDAIIDNDVVRKLLEHACANQKKKKLLSIDTVASGHNGAKCNECESTCGRQLSSAVTSLLTST